METSVVCERARSGDAFFLPLSNPRALTHAPLCAVFHTSLQSISQSNHWTIPEPLLRLVDAVIPRHTAQPDLLSRQGRISHPKKPESPLQQESNHHRKRPRKGPELTRRRSIACVLPCRASKVPEGQRLVICDEEGFAIHFCFICGA